MDITRFFLSGHTFSDEEYELELRYLFFNAIFILLAVTFLILSTIRFSQGIYIHGVIDATVVIVSITSLFLMRRNKQIIFTLSPYLLILFFLLLTYSFAKTNQWILGASWYIVYLFPVFYLMGVRIGLLSYTASMIAIALFYDGSSFEYFYITIPLTLSVAFFALYALRDASSQKIRHNREELRRKEKILLEAQKIGRIGNWELHLNDGSITWSPQLYHIYGVSPESFTPNFDRYLAFLNPEDQTRVTKAIQHTVTTGAPQNVQHKVHRHDGTVAIVEVRGIAHFDTGGKAYKLTGTSQDITELVQLQQRHEELSRILRDATNEIYILDFETHRYLFVNNGALDALGYTLDEMLACTVFDINPELTPDIVAHFKTMAKNSNSITNTSLHRRKNGSTYYVSSHLHRIRYQGRDAYAIFDTDATEQVLNKKRLAHLAHHDALTHLPNRTLFNDRLSQAIIKAKRTGEQFALFFIDLDQFKQINDSLGHETGDKVLCDVATRLRGILREEDTLARLGGDEFIIIFEGIKTVHVVSSLAEKILRNFSIPLLIEQHELFLTCSIGISIYPQDGTDGVTLLKNADAAMYRTKDDGRNGYNFYTRDMTETAFERILMETHLRRALSNNEFIVYYQPQYRADTAQLTGMEALIRWNHPDMGLVSPAKFISFAEENGMIVDIDRKVLELVLLQIRTWRENGLENVPVSLNLSMKQLEKNDFFDLLRNQLALYEVPPQNLLFEVTEGQIMKYPERSIALLKEMSRLGVALAIDDFGTGYSSLAYLKKLPIHKLKIDQSFIRDLPHDEEDAAITRSIIALSKSMRLDLIAEGVETEAQRNFLLEAGCVEHQGYFYSKPVPAETIATLLKPRS